MYWLGLVQNLVHTTPLPSLVHRHVCHLAENPTDQITLADSVIAQGHHMSRLHQSETGFCRHKSVLERMPHASYHMPISLPAAATLLCNHRKADTYNGGTLQTKTASLHLACLMHQT